MSRAWFLGLIAFALVISALATLNGGQLALLISILLYWSYSLLRAPGKLKLDVQRTVSPERAASDALVRIRLEVLNGAGDIDELALEDAVPPGLTVIDGTRRHLVSLVAGERFSFEYSVRGVRGAYSFGQLRMAAGDSLGLLRRVEHADASGRLVVMPWIRRIKAFPIRPRRTRVYSGTIPARVAGAGVEFFGIRPYSQGDATRRINWRVVARHPENLYCNDFQQERVADVAIILDGRERANLRSKGGALFESSVAAAGSLADALLQQGNRVGLLVYSRYLQWTFPGYGKVQRERILRALAQAAPGASQVFEGLQYLPTRLFPAESQIILVTPVLEGDVATIIGMRARGYQVLVVAPDPVSFELVDLPGQTSRYSRQDASLAARIVRLERRLMLGTLRRGGVQVVEWDISIPFDQAMGVASRQLSRSRVPA